MGKIKMNTKNDLHKTWQLMPQQLTMQFYLLQKLYIQRKNELKK